MTFYFGKRVQNHYCSNIFHAAVLAKPLPCRATFHYRVVLLKRISNFTLVSQKHYYNLIYNWPIDLLIIKFNLFK